MLITCLPFSVLLSPFLQMTWKCCSYDHSQAAFCPFLRPLGPAWGNGTNQSTQKCVHVMCSLLGTSVTFLSLFQPQFPIINSTPSPTSKTWGFRETRFSPRIQQGYCYSWSTLSEICTSVCIATDCAMMRSHLTYAMEADSPNPGIVWMDPMPCNTTSVEASAKCCMRKSFPDSTSSRWNADTSKLTFLEISVSVSTSKYCAKMHSYLTYAMGADFHGQGVVWRGQCL